MQHHLMHYFGRLLKLMRRGFCSVKFPPVQGLIVQQQCFAASCSIITINQPACFFISGCNGHCMFGTYWLAIGSTCPFINLATVDPGVRNICLSQAGWRTEWLNWSVLPPIRQSKTPGQQSLLAVSWQQSPPMKLQSWFRWCSKGYFLFCHWYFCPLLVSANYHLHGPTFCFCFRPVQHDLIVWDIIYCAIPFSPSALPTAFKAGWALCVFVFPFLSFQPVSRLLDCQSGERSLFHPADFLVLLIDLFI